MSVKVLKSAILCCLFLNINHLPYLKNFQTISAYYDAYINGEEKINNVIELMNKDVKKDLVLDITNWISENIEYSDKSKYQNHNLNQTELKKYH